MKPQKIRHERRSSLLYSPKYWLLLMSFCSLAVGIVVYNGRHLSGLTPTLNQKEGHPADAMYQKSAELIHQNVLDFHMFDFEHGWVRYKDGVVKTDDGGGHWQEAEASMTNDPTEGNVVADAVTLGLLDLRKHPQPDTLTVGSKAFLVKQSQFLTDRIGWALVEDIKELQTPLLVTADGGQTWSNEVTPGIRASMIEEKDRLLRMKKEAAMYASADIAKSVIHSEWTLLPETSAPGDVVLVRHNKPGKVEWLGKTYTLEPFGDGYFTYLPLTIEAKPGKYSIGDQTLTIHAKKFETQYLKVTQQMESMRQDTQRIQADHKKIDLARSKSEPEFLFNSPFVQPVEGILTTPYGYTRYVNGKYDRAHMAIDLAAKEGTPIKATNDGIVVLAESMYLTGNSVYIDHGMGLFSQYAHLSELRVKAGDRVKQGDIIGLVGTTGFSTGPHLHFTFWAHNVQVNPNLFFNTTPFQWLKGK
ncbi:M23 family metallopeptidase [Paenibacillus guangzhouensis]|uniref:M23 family metallopeptidase n=1 Tax=Paenibacillus guangzhouensis TaxID=1473112 RepID=UPI001D11509D|nr:M23 family metallopeptidase [Paenibacillus guangzhouensis]